MSDFINVLISTTVTWICLFSVLITAPMLFYCLHRWDKEWKSEND